MTRILPFVEQANTYLQVDFTAGRQCAGCGHSPANSHLCLPERDPGRDEASYQFIRPQLDQSLAHELRGQRRHMAGLGRRGTTGRRRCDPILQLAATQGGNKVGDFTDGLSNTIGFAEVKAYTWILKTNTELGRRPDPGPDSGGRTGPGWQPGQHPQRPHRLDRGPDIPHGIHIRSAAEHASHVCRSQWQRRCGSAFLERWDGPPLLRRGHVTQLPYRRRERAANGRLGSVCPIGDRSLRLVRCWNPQRR